ERIEDRWIISQLNQLISKVTGLLEDFQFGEAAQQIYDFVWSKFCDWYIEIAKIRFRSDLEKPSPLPFLVDALEKSLRLLHPFMPFITEELWQGLKARLPCSARDNAKMPASIMIAPYPVAKDAAIHLEADGVMDSVTEIIRSIRNARAEHRVETDKWVEAQVYSDELLPSLVSQREIIEQLARAKPLAILSRQERKPCGAEALTLVLREAELVLPLAGLTDRKAEKERLLKESEIVQARIAQLDARLKDSAFLTKAPAHIIEKEKQNLDLLRDKLKRLNLELSHLTS
ncbi:MAG TPA: class I tRNA ligase family protein, partial [Dehalococcoidia bacterium]|nr:class I tRNA ligase family protein [Dehalococcoidia bacterium]